MQTSTCLKRLTRCALATFICLALPNWAEGADVRLLHNQKGTIPRDPPRLRIPHHAFQTWLSSDVPDDSQLAKWMGEPKKPGVDVMGAIHRFRAKICWQMKDTHGEKFDSFEACKKFMEDACRPGGDLEMDDDNGEVSSGKGYCQEYFPEDEEAAEKVLEDVEADDDSKKAKAAEDAKKAAAARKAKEAEDAKKAAAMKSAKEAELAKAAAAKGKDAKQVPEEKAAPASPAPAAAGAPAGAGLPADEAWYFKNGNKDPARYHMNEEMKLPTQGYWGRLVEHDDMKTATSDWHNEFDETASVSAICQQHPENPWCRKKGHGAFGGFHRSGSLALAASMAPILLMLVATTGFN